MSWEIQGRVQSAADVDALVAEPSERPSADEATQVAAVASALKSLVQVGVVAGDLYVRAGGNANPGGGPVAGCAHEMVTLTIDYAPPIEDPEGGDEADAEADVTAEPPVEGTVAEPDPEG